MKTSMMKLPEKEIDVKLSKEIADKLNPIAMRIGEQFRLYGFRAKINFRTIVLFSSNDIKHQLSLIPLFLKFNNYGLCLGLGFGLGLKIPPIFFIIPII